MKKHEKLIQMAKAPNHIKPLPYSVYFWTTTAIALAGLADAVYLAISHYRVYTDMGYKSFCSISKAINCDTVSQSPYSILLQVPVPVWGIFGYLLFLMLIVCLWKPADNKTRFWPTLAFLAFSFSIYSIVLAFISTFYIRSYCIMCIANYAVNFLLLYFTWLTHRRFSNVSIGIGLKDDFQLVRKHARKSVALFSILVIILILLIAFFPSYWTFTPKAPDNNIPTGMTAEGHPWIGAEYPQITIMEFTDYQCFQCKKMHFYLRELISHYPGKIRLIHRNFPMDHVYNPLVKAPFHVGSGKMALFSLFAAEKGNFWLFSDLLFNIDKDKGHFQLRDIAQTAGFTVKELARAVITKHLLYKLRVDIRDGLKLGISGTPGYVINGKVYIGNVPAEVFRGLRE